MESFALYIEFSCGKDTLMQTVWIWIWPPYFTVPFNKSQVQTD